MSFINKIIYALLTPVRVLMMLFSRIIPGFKKLPRISIPMRVALLVCLMLIIFLVMAYWNYRIDSENAKVAIIFRDWWGVPLAILLLISITVCVYVAVDLLTRRRVAPYPDIEKAWRAGLTATRDLGIDLNTTPVFLVIGSKNESVASSLHAAAGMKSSLDGIPAGPAPLHWHGNEQAIFIHVCDVSGLSKLLNSTVAAKPGAAPHGSGPSGFTGTIVGGAAGTPPPAAATGGTRTLTAGEISLEGTHKATDIPAAGKPPVHPGTRTIGAAPAPSAVLGRQPGGSRSEISSNELDVQRKRLSYVCHLLRRHRHPICPINGVVTIVPFSAIEWSHDQVQVALDQDLGTIETVCRLKFPVTLLVSEIEHEPGFLEFMRRLSPDEVKGGRIGSRYGNADTDIWTPITEERIREMSTSASKNIEDNILGFYRREDALSRRGNELLFTLLSKIRGKFGGQFEGMWVAALGRVQCLITGCYFVAMAEGEDRQGFVASVIQDKVIANRGKLSWQPSAIKENSRWLLLSSFLALAALASIGALAFMMIRLFWPVQ